MEDMISRAEHSEFTKRMDEENKRQNHRLDTIEKSIETFSRIAGSVERLAENMKTMATEQARLSERIGAIEKKPADNWNTIIKSILTNFGATIAALIVGALVLSNVVK